MKIYFPNKSSSNLSKKMQIKQIYDKQKKKKKKKNKGTR